MDCWRRRIWLRYADGIEWRSGSLPPRRKRCFPDEPGEDRPFFEEVHIGGGNGISWGNEIDLCPDALYLQLTGKRPELLRVVNIVPSLRTGRLNAGD